jgi:hypothetical protein
MEKQTYRKLTPDSSLNLSPTKLMIVEENAKKWKIYFCPGQPVWLL